MRITQESTIAIVIDYQEKLMPAMYECDKLYTRTKILLSGLKALEIPMIVTEQYPKGLGRTAPEIEELVGDCPHYEKMTFSVCDTEEIMDAIKAYGKKNVIVCGAEAHVCVLQTVIDLVDAGFTPIWVSDCISSRFMSDKETAEKRALHEGAVMTSSEAILFELQRVSGTDSFKVISKLVK